MEVDDTSIIAFREFVERASKFLGALSVSDVLDAVYSTDTLWHPTGFIVARTHLQFDGMPVRLHCWPRGVRIVEDGRPLIHNHVWPLCSRVISGTYTERIYNLEPVDPDHSDLQVYSVEYHNWISSTVTPSEQFVRVATSEDGTYHTGMMHSLAAGAWHESIIPRDDQVMTVMVTGQAELPSPLLVGRTGWCGGPNDRTAVTHAEFARYVESSLNADGSQ